MVVPFPKNAAPKDLRLTEFMNLTPKTSYTASHY